MGTRHPFARSGQTVDFIQRIRTTEQALWRALTTPEGILSWLRCSEAYVSEQPGGEFYLRWRTRGVASGRTEFGYHGGVLEYDPCRYLAVEYHAEETEVPTYLSWHVRPSSAPYADAQVADIDLHLIHSGFPETVPGAFSYDGHSHQWRRMLGGLAARLEGRPGRRIPRSFLGVMFVGGVPGTGLLIRDVITNSPAHRARLRAGDVLCAVDGQPMGTLDDFHDWLEPQPAGTTNLFTLLDRSVEVTSEDVDRARRRLEVVRG
jgi:uncharacterized protein YndB with AHSA1/START domain